MNVATTNSSTADFRELALQVRAAGLLNRRRTYYIVKIGLTIAALAGGWAAFVVVGNSWATLGVAVFLGAVFAQLGFIGHDAGHHQISSSRRGNRLVGLLVGNALIGLSFGWWVPKHNAHHSHPNEIGRDPDVGSDAFGVFRTTVSESEGPTSVLVRWRAPLFFPLMLFRSVGLHVGATRRFLGERERGALGEALLVLLHAATYFTIVFLVLSPVKALAFIIVHQGVFSIYLGVSFAPNHKGMPVIPAGSRLDFARRQICTSRNVSGGALLTFVLGGLDYQIEHHLFPSMPRPNLRRCQSLVKAFCQTNGLAYCEVGFFESFRLIVRHLRTRSDESTSVRREISTSTSSPG